MNPQKAVTAAMITLALAAGMFQESCFLFDGGDWPEGDIQMITPFVSSADIASINEAYSEHAACPWGFEHRGIDFMTGADLVPFRAVCNGRIVHAEPFYNNGNGFWQVNVEIKYNRRFRVSYTFEPFSPGDSNGAQQMSHLVVSEGDQVSSGQVIGYLKYGGPGAHVDFSLQQDGDSTCPEPYFTPAAYQSIMTILQDTIPGAAMCYR